MPKNPTRKERATADLERVARLLAGQDEPRGKWLSVRQTAWLVGVLRNAGVEGHRPWGHEGYRRTVVYDCKVCQLAVSPLNGAGSFRYNGTAEYRAAELAKRMAEIKAAEDASKNERTKRVYDLERTITQCEIEMTKSPNLDWEVWLKGWREELASLKKEG